jgi:aerobic-type carbon monoxide dehydrogenase small subunit (CoxS/CutS family)
LYAVTTPGLTKPRPGPTLPPRPPHPAAHPENTAMRVVSFTLNGKPTRLTVDEARPLLWVLRDDLGLTGTKFGCGEGVCGSCTVVVNNLAVRSCATPIGDVDGKKVVTIEGLAGGEKLHAIQQAFVDHVAYQCGYCTPGMIMGAYALLLKNPKATRADIVRELDSHLCRCGAHVRILQAVESAAVAMKGGAR